MSRTAKYGSKSRPSQKPRCSNCCNNTKDDRQGISSGRKTQDGRTLRASKLGHSIRKAASFRPSLQTRRQSSAALRNNFRNNLEIPRGAGMSLSHRSPCLIIENLDQMNYAPQFSGPDWEIVRSACLKWIDINISLSTFIQQCRLRVAFPLLRPTRLHILV
jgi:hypothetical protein